jgi:hypothetical protein
MGMRCPVAPQFMSDLMPVGSIVDELWVWLGYREAEGADFDPIRRKADGEAPSLR